MAVYAAVISLDQIVANIIAYTGLVLSNYNPLFVEMLEIAPKELKSLEEFMERFNMSSRMRMNAFLRQIAEATCQFHKSFNSLMDKLKDAEGMFNQEARCIEDFRQDTHSFIDTLKKMKEEYLKQDTHLPNQQDEVVDSESKMVGLSDVYAELKRTIFNCHLTEHVFSIVGMTGIGKIALVEKLFEDLDVLEWFNCPVWVTVGKKYQWEEITQSIQAQLNVDVDNMLITRGCLRESLMGKRCLIMLDDVWDMELVKDYLKTSIQMQKMEVES